MKLALALFFSLPIFAADPQVAVLQSNRIFCNMVGPLCRQAVTVCLKSSNVEHKAFIITLVYRDADGVVKTETRLVAREMDKAEATASATFYHDDVTVLSTTIEALSSAGIVFPTN